MGPDGGGRSSSIAALNTESRRGESDLVVDGTAHLQHGRWVERRRGQRVERSRGRGSMRCPLTGQWLARSGESMSGLAVGGAARLPCGCWVEWRRGQCAERVRRRSSTGGPLTRQWLVSSSVNCTTGSRLAGPTEIVPRGCDGAVVREGALRGTPWGAEPRRGPGSWRGPGLVLEHGDARGCAAASAARWSKDARGSVTAGRLGRRRRVRHAVL